MLYYSLVYSALQYNITAWGSASNSILKPLNIIHNKIARLLTNSNKYIKLTTLYRVNDILNISQIFQLQTGKFMQIFS